ncbi:MAG: glycosyltransferase family 39 protein [Anaerolineales bacterium]|nr:glycosyltransferase family 39 protein [Anaerolineales bacterium]
MMKQRIRILVAALVLVAMLLPRVAELTKFTAADEPFWLVVGANYYYALTHRELENTVYEYHPAVTTMWIGAAAMLIYFPEYRGLMNGYFQQEKTSFDTYLLEHNKNPLTLLWWARLLQLLLNVFLFLVAFLLLRSMLDEWIALAVLLLTSFAPYLFGQSRLLNHESMVGLFSLIAVLAMAAHLFSKPQPALAILSAASAALANLTKSSAIVLFPVITIMVLVAAFNQWRVHKKAFVALGAFLKTYGWWIVAFGVTYFIAWPGMWVAPEKMLYEVYGNAFSYAFQGARLSVTHELQPARFSLASVGAGFLNLSASLVWRTTPITWLGFLLALVFLFQKNLEVIPAVAKYLIAFLLLEALACIGMFATVQGRDQPHYILAAYYGIEFSAALGWAYGLRWLARSFGWANRARTQLLLFAAVFLAQAYPLLFTAPYFFTYLNPLLPGRPAPFHYGEQMEVAAAYLAQKPDAEHQTALVYFGRSFSYYYPGKTLLFAPVLFDDQAQLIERLRQSNYLVVYTGLEERLPLLKQLTPERVIELAGRPDVAIYRVSDIPASFYGE